jgi:hypothetical protein
VRVSIGNRLADATLRPGRSGPELVLEGQAFDPTAAEYASVRLRLANAEEWEALRRAGFECLWKKGPRASDSSCTMGPDTK